MRLLLTLGLLVTLISSPLVTPNLTAQEPAKVDSSAAEKAGWKLGTQTYTFNRFTFFEALDKAASVGLKYAEA